jgi:hypothetical protein
LGLKKCDRRAAPDLRSAPKSDLGAAIASLALTMAVRAACPGVEAFSAKPLSLSNLELESLL